MLDILFDGLWPAQHSVVLEICRTVEMIICKHGDGMRTDQFIPEEDYELSAGFLRQRRNLILISLLLPIFAFGEARLESLSIFGADISIGEPIGLYAIVIMIFIYFSFRYWQYVKNERGMALYRYAVDKYIYRFEFNYFSKLIEQKVNIFECDPCYVQFNFNANSQYNKKYCPPIISQDEGRLLSRKRLMQIHGTGQKYAQHYQDKNYGQEKLTSDEVNKINEHWGLVKKQQGDQRSEPIFETEVNYNVLLVKLLRLKAYVYFVISRPDFTDFKFPILLGAVSFLTSIAKVIYYY